MMEPAAFAYAVRHDNIEAIYKKLEERRDTADVTDLLKELHRIVNEAIRAAAPGDDQRDAKLFDMSTIDLEKLRDEFAKKVTRKASALEDIRQVVEKKLAQMLARFPRLSETFVLRELLGLEAAGVRILVDSLMAPEQGIRHRELDDLRAEVTLVHGASEAGSAAGWRRALRVAVRHPVRWLAMAIAARRTGRLAPVPAGGHGRGPGPAGGCAAYAAHFATAAAEVATMAARLAGVICSVTAHAKDIHHQDNAPHVARRLAPADTVVTVSEANVRHLRAMLSGPGQTARRIDPQRCPARAAGRSRCVHHAALRGAAGAEEGRRRPARGDRTPGCSSSRTCGSR